MAICDHQFHGGDESDWILSTSASCWDGNTTAGRILQELFKKTRQNMVNKPRRKRHRVIVAPSEKMSIPEDAPSPKQNENLIVRKMPGFYNFDESQHVNGCPVKWLYNRRMLDRNKIYKMERLCNGRKEEGKKEKRKNVRDKTPAEVKIHKINLIEKYTTNLDEPHAPYVKPTSEMSEKDIENYRKKLAAKLNWKLHDDSPDDGSFDTNSDISCRHNYLPPRPLLGLKPLLSVLLAPHQGGDCTFVSLQGSLSKKKKVEASLSIQSLDLPLTPQQTKPRPKTTNALRWGSKSSALSKKLQIPNQITIKLEQQQKKPPRNGENQLKIAPHNPPVKKSNDKNKQTKSLSSLFYELKDKTNSRNEFDEYFEEMLKDLTMEESRYKIRRFFNIESANSDFVDGIKITPEKRKKLLDVPSGDDSELNLVCERVRFFQKKLPRGKQDGVIVSN